jgi:PAS domain S-box-containing protein
MRYLPASPLRSEARLASLLETELLSGGTSAALGVLAQLGSKLLRAGTMITAVEPEAQTILASAGLPPEWDRHARLPLDYSFCQQVVRSGDALVLADARRSALVATSPSISEFGVIAYAGSPWRTRDGAVQGAYCAIDMLPRAWTTEELRALDMLASLVTEHVARLGIDAARTAQAAPPALLSTVLEASPVGVCILQRGRFTHVSHRFAEIFGYSQAELLQLTDALQLVAASDRVRVANDLRTGPGGEERRTLQPFRGRRKDGERIWLEGQATHALVEGEPSVIGLIIDITHRVRFEEAVKDSERRLRHVVKATNDIIWEWNIVTGQLRWHDDAHLLLRYSQEQLGSAIEWRVERIHPDDRVRVVATLQGVLAGTGDLWSDEYRFLRGDGSWAAVLDRGSVIRDARGVPLRVIGATLDMTERRRGEHAQRLLAQASSLLDESLESENGLNAFVRLLVPAIADVCVLHLMDTDGRMRLGAVAAEAPHDRRLGEPRAGDDDPLLLLAEHVGRTGDAVMMPRFDERAWRRLGWALDSDARPNGSLPESLVAVPLQLHGASMGTLTLAATGRGRHYDAGDLTLAQDLARRAAIAIEHSRLYAAAQRAIQAREDILNMVTHDLRNPLSTVRMATDLLQETTAERREDHRKWLEMISRAADRMSSMIDELRDLSNVDAGRFVVEPVDVDGSRLLAEVCEALTPVALQLGLTIECIAIGDLGGCRADERQIIRVFSNLVGNALKFTPPGGRVEICGERLDGEALFTVRDNGPGIASDHLPHVFDRYWQARQGDRRGIGLGLAIAKGIVEAHGGRIWADSTPGEGATFYFTLPFGRA